MTKFNPQRIAELKAEIQKRAIELGRVDDTAGRSPPRDPPKDEPSPHYDPKKLYPRNGGYF
jgi:hypothetical protein